METEFEIQIDPEVQEILDDLPPVVVARGERTHPMFSQWNKMILGCSEPKYPTFPVLGARKVTVFHPWYTFANFVRDMEPTFEYEPSKPAILRNIYLARHNSKAGFNPKNAFWTNRSEATKIQSRTVYVDTPFGRQMTFRELEEYLRLHAGEPLPSTVEPPKYWMRTYDHVNNRWDRVLVTIDTIAPVTWQELRRRYRLGQDLIRPPRPYKDKAEDYKGYESPSPSEFRSPAVTQEVMDAYVRMQRKSNPNP